METAVLGYLYQGVDGQISGQLACVHWGAPYAFSHGVASVRDGQTVSGSGCTESAWALRQCCRGRRLRSSGLVVEKALWRGVRGWWTGLGTGVGTRGLLSPGRLWTAAARAWPCRLNYWLRSRRTALAAWHTETHSTGVLILILASKTHIRAVSRNPATWRHTRNRIINLKLQSDHNASVPSV
jgi:hypothetical protein